MRKPIYIPAYITKSEVEDFLADIQQAREGLDSALLRVSDQFAEIRAAHKELDFQLGRLARTLKDSK